MPVLPSSVLFACTWNAVRSPMAEGLMKLWYGGRVYVDSVGVRRGHPVDPFAVAALEEVGADISGHRPKVFEELDDTSFDLIISLSPEAQHKAVEMTRTSAAELDFWHTFDPSVIEGSREVRLGAYREVRDRLIDRLKERFGPPLAPVV